MMSIEKIEAMSIRELEISLGDDIINIADRFALDPDTYPWYTAEMAAEDLANFEDTENDPEQYADEMNMYIALHRKVNAEEE